MSRSVILVKLIVPSLMMVGLFGCEKSTDHNQADVKTQALPPAIENILTVDGQSSSIDAKGIVLEYVRQEGIIKHNTMSDFAILVKNGSQVNIEMKGPGEVSVAYLWINKENGALVSNESVDSQIMRNIAPGESLEVPLKVQAPASPGSYILKIDLKRNGLGFLSDHGSNPLHYDVVVK